MHFLFGSISVYVKYPSISSHTISVDYIESTFAACRETIILCIFFNFIIYFSASGPFATYINYLLKFTFTSLYFMHKISYFPYIDITQNKTYILLFTFYLLIISVKESIYIYTHIHICVYMCI